MSVLPIRTVAPASQRERPREVEIERARERVIDKKRESYRGGWSEWKRAGNRERDRENPKL